LRIGSEKRGREARKQGKETKTSVKRSSEGLSLLHGLGGKLESKAARRGKSQKKKSKSSWEKKKKRKGIHQPDNAF